MPADQELRDRLRLKYVPFDPDPETIADAEAFLSMNDNEQRQVLDTSFNEQAEFFIALLTARALYKSPVDRSPGSITQEKLDAYPDRYGSKS